MRNRKLEHDTDIEEFLNTVDYMHELRNISEETISKAVDIIKNCQNKVELSERDVLDVNIDMLSLYIREYTLKYMGFAIITTELMDELAQYLQGKRVLEVMAGCGSLSKALQDRGIETIPTDNELWATEDSSIYTEWGNAWTYIEHLDILDAVEKYHDVDTIIISWPPYNSNLPLKMLRRINPKTEVIYIGEGYGGATSNSELYDQTHYVINKEFEKVKERFINWKGLRDSINIIALNDR